MDLQNEAEADEGSGPKLFQRDYREIAKKLPVFCVSSKAYQKLSGRLKNDERIIGFPHIEDTEIPALQVHALSIAHQMRAATCRRFLGDLGRFLTSLHLQVIQSDQPLKLADDLRAKELQCLNSAIAKLKRVGVSGRRARHLFLKFKGNNCN